jgi:hypothetical protein
MRYPGSGRVSRAGDRVLAIANFICDFASAQHSDALEKFVSARRRNQHAGTRALSRAVALALNAS